MSFKDSVPTRLSEYPTVMAFMDVLDGLQEYKDAIISEYVRMNNYGLLTDKKWLLRKLEDYGITGIPIDYPVPIMQQLLLNADTICGTRGSKIGIELICSVLTLGEVSVDDSNFYTPPKTLLLDSTVQGYVTNDSTSDKYYLCGDSDDINPATSLSINIKSEYFSGKYPAEADLIKSYLWSSIGNWLGFSPNRKVSIKYQSRDGFYFHKLLNSYFI